VKKNELYHNSKTRIQRSPIHGWGIFATEDIVNGEVLEEVPFLIVPMAPMEASSLFLDYRFNYPAGQAGWKHQAIPFGFACIYNHSNTNNAEWYTDEENEIFIFKTIKDIKSGEEILTYYGSDNYWNDGRQHTKII
jgi:uncharacterized protein